MASLGRTTADRLTTDSFSRVAGALGLFAAIIYSAIPLQIVVHTNIGWIHGYVSDLGASGQPYAWMFQAIDGISGICIIVLAVALYRRASATPLRAIGCGALGLFGVSALGDSLMPLECSSYLSAACKRAEDAGLLSWQHQGHLFLEHRHGGRGAGQHGVHAAGQPRPAGLGADGPLVVAGGGAPDRRRPAVRRVGGLAAGRRAGRRRPAGDAAADVRLDRPLSVLVLRPPLDDRPGAGERPLVATRA